MTSYLDEMEYHDEIRGVICPECGGSLVWVKGRAYCDEHSFVEPAPEDIPPAREYTDDELRSLMDKALDE